MLSGAMQLSPFDIAKTSSTRDVQLGQIGVTPDGRAFRFGRAGASDLSPGKLAVAATITANHENMAVAAAASVGATSVTVTLGATAATENQYAGGFLIINDAAGEGTAYLVSGHPAADSAASLEVTLAEPIRVALTTSSEATLQKNPWDSAVISATDQGDKAVGIPVVTIAAGKYGWLQTHGLCSALADETLAVGSALTIGTGVAGALEVLDAAGEQYVGDAIQAGVDTEYRGVYLRLD